MSEPNAITDDLTPVSFEAGMEELRSLLERLEDDQLGLEAIIITCRRAKILEHSLRNYLVQAQGKLEQLDASELPRLIIGEPEK